MPRLILKSPARVPKLLRTALHDNVHPVPWLLSTGDLCANPSADDYICKCGRKVEGRCALRQHEMQCKKLAPMVLMPTLANKAYRVKIRVHEAQQQRQTEGVADHETTYPSTRAGDTPSSGSGSEERKLSTTTSQKRARDEFDLFDDEEDDKPERKRARLLADFANVNPTYAAYYGEIEAKISDSMSKAFAQITYCIENVTKQPPQDSSRVEMPAHDCMANNRMWPYKEEIKEIIGYEFAVAFQNIQQRFLKLPKGPSMTAIGQHYLSSRGEQPEGEEDRAIRRQYRRAAVNVWQATVTPGEPAPPSPQRQ